MECLIGWLKECRRVFSRFEKTAKNFGGMIKMAFIQRYLRLVLQIAVFRQSLARSPRQHGSTGSFPHRNRAQAGSAHCEDGGDRPKRNGFRVDTLPLARRWRGLRLSTVATGCLGRLSLEQRPEVIAG